MLTSILLICQSKQRRRMSRLDRSLELERSVIAKVGYLRKNWLTVCCAGSTLHCAHRR